MNLATLCVALLLAVPAQDGSASGRAVPAPPSGAPASEGSAAAAAEPELEIVAPAQVRLGDWFEIVVRSSRPVGENARLSLPDRPVDAPPADVMARRSTLRDTITGAELRLPVALLRPGRITLEGLLLQDGSKVSSLRPLAFEVTLDLPPEHVPRVAEPLDPLTLRLPRPPVWVFAASSVVALALIGAWVVSVGRERVEVVYVPPADHIALAALERLRLSPPRTSDEVAALIVAVSDVLRDYIEGRFAVHAPARTTEEFLLEALIEPALAERKETLDHFLTLCDLVKYARVRPAPQEALALVDTAAAFVEQTR